MPNKKSPPKIKKGLNKKISLLVFLLSILIVVLIYLSRSYAFFFDNIGAHNLKSPFTQKEYQIISTGNTRHLKYAAVGDSLTAGVGSNDFKETFSYQLANNFAKDSVVTFRNEGYPAARVADLVPKIDEINDFNPDIITILIGINDAFNRTPINEYRKDLDTLIINLKKDNRKIYLITIPYLGTPKSVYFPFNILYDIQLNRYNAVIRDLAEDHHLKLIDLYSLSHNQFTTDSTFYAADLFHPSEKGYILISDLISDAVTNP